MIQLDTILDELKRVLLFIQDQLLISQATREEGLITQTDTKEKDFSKNIFLQNNIKYIWYVI